MNLGDYGLKSADAVGGDPNYLNLTFVKPIDMDVLTALVGDSDIRIISGCDGKYSLSTQTKGVFPKETRIASVDGPEITYNRNTGLPHIVREYGKAIHGWDPCDPDVRFLTIGLFSIYGIDVPTGEECIPRQPDDEIPAADS